MVLLRIIEHRPELMTRFLADKQRVQQFVQTAFRKLVADEEVVFHSDARTIGANLLLWLQRQSVLLSDQDLSIDLSWSESIDLVSMLLSDHDLSAFASKVDRLLLTAGHFGLQNHIVWLLHGYAPTHRHCQDMLSRLEARFGPVEPEIALTPSAPNEARRVSPRKMLNAYNSHYIMRSQVLSMLPLALCAFGWDIEIHEQAWLDWNLASRDFQCACAPTHDWPARALPPLHTQRALSALWNRHQP